MDDDMMEDLRMAELLCTRLCHDLTGPIGAVNNGAEFLSEEGFNMQNQAVELIVSSAFSAVSRLQFYRLAYGRVKDHGEAALMEQRKMAEDYFAGSKITLDWPDAHTDAAGVSVSMKMVRLMYNLLIICSGSLIRGGTIAVRLGQQDNEKQISITANGPSLKWDAETAAMFAKPISAEAMSPKNVQFYLTQRLVEELGATLTIEAEGEMLAFSIRQSVPVETPEAPEALAG